MTAFEGKCVYMTCSHICLHELLFDFKKEFAFNCMYTNMYILRGLEIILFVSLCVGYKAFFC